MALQVQAVFRDIIAPKNPKQQVGDYFEEGTKAMNIDVRERFKAKLKDPSNSYVQKVQENIEWCLKARKSIAHPIVFLNEPFENFDKVKEFLRF